MYDSLNMKIRTTYQKSSTNRLVNKSCDVYKKYAGVNALYIETYHARSSYLR